MHNLKLRVRVYLSKCSEDFKSGTQKSQITLSDYSKEQGRGLEYIEFLTKTVGREYRKIILNCKEKRYLKLTIECFYAWEVAKSGYLNHFCDRQLSCVGLYPM